MHHHEHPRKSSPLCIHFSTTPSSLLLALGLVAFLAVLPVQADTHGAWFAISNSKTLPFQPIGTMVNTKQNPPALRCDLASPLARTIYRLLLDLYSRRGGPSVNFYSVDLCKTEYLPLGGERFLIHYYKLGILDLRKGVYSLFTLPSDEGGDFSAPYAIDSRTSIRTYLAGGIVSGQAYQAYSIIVFTRTHNGSADIRYQGMDGGDEGDDSDHRPLCDNEEPRANSGPEWAKSIEPPRIKVDRQQLKAVFDFIKWTKNCATSELKSEHDIFIYRNGRLFNARGKEIPLYTLP